MKAKDLTVKGHYWYLEPEESQWVVVHFDTSPDFSAYPFEWVGSDNIYKAEEMPGTFAGPILPPTSKDLP